MKDRLIDQINSNNFLKKYESYPICFLSENNIEDNHTHLKEAVRHLQAIRYDDELSKIINKEDFGDIVMFLSERLCLMRAANLKS